MSIARLQERNGQFVKAYELYEEAYRQDRKNVEVCRRLAVVATHLGKNEEAVRYFEEALQRAPRDADLLCDLGYSLYLREDLAAAENLLRQSLNENPRHQRATTNLALVMGHQGQYDESFELFRQVVGKAEAHSNLAYILIQHGNGKEATKRFSQALSIDSSLQAAKQGIYQIAELQRRLEKLKARQPHQETNRILLANGSQKPPSDTQAAPHQIPRRPDSEIVGASASLRQHPVSASQDAVIDAGGNSPPSTPNQMNDVARFDTTPERSPVKNTSYSREFGTDPPRQDQVEGPAIDALIEQLHTDDPIQLKHAIHKLKIHGPAAATAVGSLELLLEHPDAQLRVEAALALCEIDACSDIVVDVLLDALKHEAPWIRSMAASAFQKTLPQRIDLLNAVAQAMFDENPFVRLQAAKSLADNTAWRERALEVLLDCLDNDDQSVRWIAVYSLADLTPQDAESINSLVHALRDSDSRVRAGAALALGEIGPTAQFAIPELERSTEDANELVRSNAARAVRSIHPRRS
jgi:HEAT repeat protein